MIVVAQRVSRAEVRVAGNVVGAIGPGLCLLACAVREDTEREVDWLAGKLAVLRVFADGRGRRDLSLLDTGGAALLVPQFTLAADWRKGRRPGYTHAAEPDRARCLLQRLAAVLASRGVPVESGSFGAMMQVELINEGPLTLLLDSRQMPGLAGPETPPHAS